MKVSIIAAVAENLAIGKDNDLIWKLPDDMRFFMDKTKGHHVVMGRKNWESIPHKFRPLRGRPNIVISRDANYQAEDATVLHSLKDALIIAEKAGEDEAFVIGGGAIYEWALKEELVDMMYLTHVHASFDADVFFPKFDPANWNKKVLLNHSVDERHAYSFEIVEYSKGDKT